MVSQLVYTLENSIVNKNFSIEPNFTFGTHINSVGLQFETVFNKDFTVGGILLVPGFSIYTAANAYIKNLGMPGNSGEINVGSNLSLNFGIHTINYYFSYYFTTNETNQSYGQIGYKLTIADNELQITLDNDDMYFLATDKFKTTKGQVIYKKHINKNTVGVGLGFYLWTGNLDGTLVNNDAKEKRDKTYTLDGYGGDYSHGILNLLLIYNFLELSIGYDSEKIRDNIQNRWHYLYNRPKVPLVDRKDRFFFQVTIYPERYKY